MSRWTIDPPDTGILFVVSGPSGAGKTTLVQNALQTVPGLTFSVSVTTRAPREGEIEGQDYRFVSEQEFTAMVEADALLEHATVYGRRYGTPRDAVTAALSRGESVLLEIDVVGAAQVRARMPESVHVFVLPPAIDALEDRLRARGADRDEVVRRRMAEAADQLRPAPTYDYVVVNRDLDEAQRCFEAVLVAEMLRVGREVIVTFPNFGHWTHRWQILKGRMPVSQELPYQWYDTPNIHLCTVADFDAFLRERNCVVENRVVLAGGRAVHALPNLMGELAIYRFRRA